ncbi:hypothetical protein [Georgenia satyanarayanai]|uniref:hypothetical protein n=1 Tax=Georgenia satyanarayanai TaxID=860221 RepID=UPI00186B3651|nr:hypothetical protein [Georgenia satyanarayanai]
MPAHLNMIDNWSFGGLALSGYLLRSAALATWVLGQRALNELYESTREQGIPDVPVKRRIAARGALSHDPDDRLEYGELQWLQLTPDLLALHIYVDPAVPCSWRVAPSALSFEMAYKPSGSGAEAPARNEVRPPMPGDIVIDNPGNLRRMAVHGQCTPPPRAHAQEA